MPNRPRHRTALCFWRLVIESPCGASLSHSDNVGADNLQDVGHITRLADPSECGREISFALATEIILRQHEPYCRFEIAAKPAALTIREYFVHVLVVRAPQR